MIRPEDREDTEKMLLGLAARVRQETTVDFVLLVAEHDRHCITVFDWSSTPLIKAFAEEITRARNEVMQRAKGGVQ